MDLREGVSVRMASQGVTGVVFEGFAQLLVRVAAKGVRGEPVVNSRNGCCRGSNPTPVVFCVSLSKEKVCENECAEVCDSMGVRN